MIEIKAVPGKLIMLGKQGENLAREVIFDVSGVRAEFGDGTFRLSAKRPGESDAYPATVTETGDTVVWALTGADTQNAGRGQCELAYYAGETRLKTWTYDTAIAKSLTGSPKTDPYDEFLDEVNRLAASAAISQREAKNSENAAKNSEENAKASENAAKTSKDNAAEYARAALAAETKSKQNAEYAASAATAAGQYAQNAATSATNAAKSEENAKASENAAKTSEINAKSSESKAATSEKNAKASENAAKTSETNAKSSESRASASEKNAKTSETNASNSAKTASDKASAAATSETNAKKSETNAKASETNAEASKTAAETAAATATEKAAEIADSAAQIATNTENIETNATDIDLLRRENVELKAKTDALWKLSEGKSYDFVENSADGYSKDVPVGCRFAQVEKIGGKTVVWDTGELVSAAVEDAEVQGANLFRTEDVVPNGYNLAGKNIFAPGKTYTFKNISTGGIALAVFITNAINPPEADTQLMLTPNYINEGRQATFSVPDDISAYPYMWYAGGAAGIEKVFPDVKLMLVKGSTAPETYSPYSLDTYPIPDTVKALPGYGWSAGSVCNEIVRRADGWDYVQRVGLPATTDGYTALDTPTTTDITDLMAGALPLMATEPGGTITMHHALADDGLRLDMPNTIRYIRDLKEVASSGTE